MKTKSTIFLLVLALLLFGTVLNAQTATAPAVGDGSSGSPYQIATLDNLYWVTQNSGEWSKHFIQTADIDATSTSGWDGGNGFSPIGTSSVLFDGSYNGQGHTIDALTINRSGSSNMAMFGDAKGSAEIKNLGLTNVSITGGDYTAGLLGRTSTSASNSVTISGCYVTGSVTGAGNTGGFAGYILGNASTITKCWTSATVNVSGTVGGGFVGYTSGGSTISECYSTGDVNAGSNQRIGGFAGTPNGAIENCYSFSDVTAGRYSGGFIGRQYTSSISNCYCVGALTLSSSYTNGFTGRNNGNTVSNCFFDTETTGYTNSGVTGATGKTTAEMKTEATFTGASWNFTTIWQMIGSNYADLRNNSNPALPVELTSFTATEVAGGVLLEWRTATEVNNYGFEVEAEVSGSWLNVGFVEGHGNSNSPKEYSYLSNTVATSYRLKQVDTDGGFEYSDVVTVSGALAKTELYQNHPNPFNPSTQISFALASTSSVKVSVFNVLGEKVAELINSKLDAGNHNVNFDASNLTSGVYIYKIETPNYTKSMKMMLIK